MKLNPYKFAISLTQSNQYTIVWCSWLGQQALSKYKKCEKGYCINSELGLLQHWPIGATLALLLLYKSSKLFLTTKVYYSILSKDTTPCIYR